MPPETIPILPSGDFEVTVSFWSPLGFRVGGRWPDEYLILRHDALAIELHFWSNPAVDRWTNDVACYVRFPTPEEAVACHRSWVGTTRPDQTVLSDPEEGPADGSVEFHVIDPHGNLVRLGGFAT